MIIVDDGSNNPEYTDSLLKLANDQTVVILKEQNGGISKVKNTSIRAMLDYNFDYGFLLDDDMDFRHPRWWEGYTKATEASGIHHFCWSHIRWGELKRWDAEHNGFKLKQTNRVNGCCLTITKEMVAKMGGFKILPMRWASEHINYTDRALMAGFAPYYCDVTDSEKLMRLTDRNKFSSINGAERHVSLRINNPLAVVKPGEYYFPIVE